MKAITVLINMLISIIKTLNEHGFKLYDENDRDYYIDSISYCKDDDRLIVHFKEDK